MRRPSPDTLRGLRRAVAPPSPELGTAVLAIFSAAALAAGLGRAVVTSYLPVALSEIRDQPGLIGMVMLVNVAAGFLVPLWVGLWSDRLRAHGHGRTFPFILGGSLLTAGGLAAIALGTGTTYLLLALCAAVAYVGLNAVTTAHRALVAETFPPEGRPRATGAEELSMLLGGMAGIGLGGLLVEEAIWMPFAAAAVAVPLVALPTVLRMRRREATARPQERHAPRPWSYYTQAATRPGVRLVLVAQFLWVLGYAALPAFFILYSDRVLGVGPAIAGGILVGFGVMTAVTMLVAGLAEDPGRHPWLLAAGVALMGLGFVAIADTDDLAEVILPLAAAAIGFGILQTIGFPVMASFIPPGEAGAYTALYFSVRSVAGAIALPAAGWAVDLSGSYEALFAFGGLATLLGLVPIAALIIGPLGVWLRHLSRPATPPGRVIARWVVILAVAIGASLAAGLAMAETSLSDLDSAAFEALNSLGPGPEVIDRLIVDPDLRNYTILMVGTAVGAVLFRRRAVIRTVGVALLSIAVSFGLVRALWALWDRPRPQEVIDAAVVVEHDWAPFPSFPSGHVAVTLALVLVIGAVFPRARLPLAAFAVVVAVTRVLYGAHFPSDVLAAAALGLLGARASWGIMASTGLLGPWPGWWRRGRDAPTDAERTRSESRTARKELDSPS